MKTSNEIKKLTTNLSVSVLALTTIATLKEVQASDYIVPPMVNIPAGSFMMGSDTGKKSAAPRHQQKIVAFQMAKYPVTVAEFKKFAQDTNFKTQANCNDHLTQHFFSSKDGTATWNNNRYQKSDYQPVVCVTWDDANAYASWLTEKTGTVYRLPTEPEWEYAVRANTTSRYFWGDDPNFTDSCDYANLADQSSEYFVSKDYGASYVGFIDHVNCNDNEPYNSIVGLYRPNPFGLYDMVGNTKQFLANCYYEENKVYSKQAMFDESCEYIAFRGTIWHFMPELHTNRGRYKKSNKPNAILGFRLASDGQSQALAKSTQQFESKLKQAQQHRIKTRTYIVPAPQSVQLSKGKNDNLTLSWQANENENVVGFDIYRSNSKQAHLLTGFYQDHYQLVHSLPATQNTVNVELPDEGGSFRVVAKTDQAASLPSKAAVAVNDKVFSIPGRINMENVTQLDNVHLRHRVEKKNKPELYYLLKYTDTAQVPSTATFSVKVEKSSWYQLNYSGKRGGQGEFFTLWRGKNQIARIDYDKETDDKSSTRHQVFLEKGTYDIQLRVIRERPDRWHLIWLNFSQIKK